MDQLKAVWGRKSHQWGIELKALSVWGKMKMCKCHFRG